MVQRRLDCDAGFLRKDAHPDAFASIWAIRFFMRQGQPEQAHLWIDRISPNKVLAPFLQVQRVKTLWLMERHAEARTGTLSGLETLPDDWQMDLASWMCTQETAVSCKSASASCQWLREQNVEGADQDSQLSVALLHNAECLGTGADYGMLAGMNTAPAWRQLVRSITRLHSGDLENGLKMLRTIMEDEDIDEPIRAEAYRRFLSAADNVSLEYLATRADELPRNIWREIQPRFLSELASRHMSNSSSHLVQLMLPGTMSRRPASVDEGGQ